VHEAYLRMAGGPGNWENRGHFFAAAAGVMRNVLVDSARARRSRKRDGGLRVELDFAGAMPEVDLDQIILLDTALHELAALNARHAGVVELHFFGGMTFDEVGEELGVTSRTAKRDWDKARAWLQTRINGFHTNAV
jgi:RNA polymerase sigma factor (TIGR02999 family)